MLTAEIIETRKQDIQQPYYRVFEMRKPYKSIEFSVYRDFVFQIVAIVFLAVGMDYLIWRWRYSINWDLAWVSLPLFIAEVLSFIGSILMVINYWNHKNIAKQKPAHYLSEITNLKEGEVDRPIRIDVYVATYNEDLQIVEDTVKDATKMKYPFEDVEIKIHILDDGRRDGRDTEKENFKALAEKYGVNYIKREDNVGYKAGNMNNAFIQTDGDFIVILDADTRPFPNFLINTIGYFKNKKMAWVQTPQWFYDMENGKNLKDCVTDKSNLLGKIVGTIVPFSRKIKTGSNIFGTDPHLFYDIILRRRNAANAAFSCGAGSIQRREALALLGEKEKNEKIERELAKRNDLPDEERKIYRKKLEKEIPFRPFVHHISEDIFTSLMLHADEHNWESYQHPDVEARMLSPQTFNDFFLQHKRYAEGTLDIAFSKYNPLILKGLTLRQRLAYFETIWSYLSPLWLLIFMTYPVVFFFTLQPPLKAFNFDFFIRIVPFLLLNIIVGTIGNWGVGTKRAEQYYLSGFWLKLSALFKILISKNMKFNVTKKTVEYKNGLKYVWPHIALLLITLLGIGYNFYLIHLGTHPSYSAFFANIFWSIFNFYLLIPIIRAAFWKTKYIR